MSSAQVDRTSKVGHVGKKENEKTRKMFNQSRHFKFSRKRLQSFTGGNANKFFPPYKRRKKEGGIIPPTKFLLGGNICDPLNLNSMQDEEINRAMNAVTPKSSPLPTPKHRKGIIEVIIPPNINDPLSLSNCNDDEYEKQLISPTKKFSKRRNRKRKRASSGSGKEDVSHSGSETTEVKSDEIFLLPPIESQKFRVSSSSSSTSSSSEPPTVPAITLSTPELSSEIPEIPPALLSRTCSVVSSMEDELTEIISTEPEFPEADPASSPVTSLPSSPVAEMTPTPTPQQSVKDTEIKIPQPQLLNQQVKDSKVNQPQQQQIKDKDSKDKETKVEAPSPQKDKNKLRLKGLEIETKDKRVRKLDIKDKIVSPVIPQPGAWKTRPPHRPNQDKKKKGSQTGLIIPKFREKNSRYQYGNYDRYYGYRNPHHEIDPRLTVFAQRKELFYNKDILDIGCNIGHITLSVARDLAARSVTGIDIDRKLIGIARSNIKHYVNCVRSPASNDDNGNATNDCDSSFFPMSMPINYGPIDVPGFTKNKNHKGFPYNVTFVQGNYVLEDDSLLKSEQPQFDTILCLSITKWIHLNHGDSGLKQAFKRMHAQLRPGGVLVLEAQNWPSYGKKKGLTERIYRNYHSIEFFPQKFTQYLISPEVGFTQCEVVSIPPHPSKGFQRPIQLFTKAGTSPASRTIAAPSSTITRFVARAQEKKDSEIRAFERDLFPIIKSPASKLCGNLSNLSQRSSESMSSHYDQLENVYAPSSTPCYDTPSHNDNSQSAFEPEKMCYVDVGTVSNQNIKIYDNLTVQQQTSDCNDVTKTDDERKRKNNEANDHADDGGKRKKISDDQVEKNPINFTPKENYNIENLDGELNQQIKSNSGKDSSNDEIITDNT
ncbi:7SK snRNA methylphosphate capping enzyme [Microplitis demolitor]|uniref:7SK snRNA methylphosphate capping enzyme n=1 Tax=Microplitis demolitor TaxID=69319 RepID=UPI0004CD7D82|nr:7SK snRNA methylphosphate capping enzyme [Microplitis demolitor]